MSYNCLIVDDEPLARKVIREYLEKSNEQIEISESSDARHAHKVISAQKFDFIYLDINMPIMTGLELAKEINGDPLIIFSTAYAEYAVAAFEIAAFDYLVKPISYSRFEKSFQRMITELEANSVSPDTGAETSWMMIREGKRMYRVPYHELYFVQAYGDYVKIFTDHKVYLMKAKLSFVVTELPTSFVRVHRSYIVNVEKITYLEGNHVVINQEKIPVSEGKRQELLRRL